MKKCETCGLEHLHRHSDFSLLDGFATVEEYAAYSEAANQKYLCISDHGMLGCIPRQIRACDEYNLQPVFACLTAGQPIYLKDGIKPIEEVLVGDQVLTDKGRYRKVLRVMSRRYQGSLYKVKLANQTGRALMQTLTGEHPILIRSYNGQYSWIPVSQILTGRPTTKRGLKNHNSYVCYPQSRSSRSVTLKISDYLPDIFECGDTIVRTGWKGVAAYEWEIPPEFELDENFAYFLGLYVAEGSSTTNKKGLPNGAMRLSLHAKESPLVERCQPAVEAFGIKFHLYPRPEINRLDVHFGCLPLSYIIRQLCGIGSHCKKVPSPIFQSSLSVKKAFMEGLMDGDGKISGVQDVLRVASKELAWGVKRLLSDLGYWSNVGLSKDGDKECYHLSYCPERTYARSFVEDGSVMSPVQDIVELRDQDVMVYNLEVEEDNSYVSYFAVHNCELYVNNAQPICRDPEDYVKYVEENSPETKETLRKSYHLLAIAYTNQGYSNLVQLASWGHIYGWGGVPRRPRITHEQLMKHKEGLIFSSCCYLSEIGQTFDRYGRDAAFAMIEKYMAMFGDNFYLELMLLDFKKQKPYDQFLIEAHDRYHIPLNITQDCHYCKQEDAKYQQYMLMIRTKHTVADIEAAIEQGEAREGFFELQDQQLWMKTEEELNEKWNEDYTDAIPYELFCQAKHNTVEICRKAEGVEIDRTIKLPEIDEADEKLWEGLCKGFKWRGLEGKADYMQRLREEYELICRKDFSSYFLLTKMFTDEGRRACPKLIGWGTGEEAISPGRGSGVSFLSNYVLGITDVDPIRHDLVPERFLSDARGGRQLKLQFDSEPISTAHSHPESPNHPESE